MHPLSTQAQLGAARPAAHRRRQVCPLANVFKPAFGGVGLSSWTFVAAQVAFGMNMSLPSPEPPAMPPVAAPTVKGQPGADEGKPLDAVALERRFEAEQAAAEAADAPRAAAFAWMTRMCHVVYSAETACDAGVVAGLNGTKDVWGAYHAIKAHASVEDLDAAQARAVVTTALMWGRFPPAGSPKLTAADPCLTWRRPPPANYVALMPARLSNPLARSVPAAHLQVRIDVCRWAPPPMLAAMLRRGRPTTLALQTALPMPLS